MSAAARRAELLRQRIGSLAVLDLPLWAHEARADAEALAFALAADIATEETNRARETAALLLRIAELDAALSPTRDELQERIEQRAADLARVQPGGEWAVLDPAADNNMDNDGGDDA